MVRVSESRCARVFALLAIASGFLLNAAPAAADHIGSTDYSVAQVVPTVTDQPAAVTTTLNAGTALPVLVEFHHPTGHVFAHADSVEGVPDSPIETRPQDDDIVAQLVSVGDFGLDGCAGAGDTTVPDTIPLVGFWNEPFEGSAVAGKVAELKIPTSQFPLYGALVLSPGHAGQEEAHYDLRVTVPIAALACPGTTLALSSTMLDYTRRLVSLTPPTAGFPTTRVFQKHGSTAGEKTTCMAYVDATSATHQGCATYALTERSDTTPPDASFDGTVDQDIVSGVETLEVTASDNVAVAKVEFGMAGRSLGSDTSSPYEASWNTTTLDDGPTSLTARATDVSNNIIDVATIGVIVDNLEPSVTITTPSTLTGAVTATFNEPDMSGISASSFYLKVKGSASNVAGTVACASKTGAAVSCADGPVKTATFTPSATLTPGTLYESSVSPVAAPTVVDAAGNVLAPAAAEFRAMLTNQENSPAAKAAWARATVAGALGGSYTYDRLPGASASVPFSGSYVTWYTVRGPAFGNANVYVDGVLKRTVNLYRSTQQFAYPVTITGLAPGSHTLRIAAVGTKGSSAGTDTRVALDAVTSGGVRRDTPSATYTWRRAITSLASGGAYSISNTPGSVTDLRFTGTRVDWYTVRGPAMGIAKVYVDGVLKATVDNYAASTTFGVLRRISGLTNATHTVRIVVTGTRSAASKGTAIAIDRWVVG